MDGKRTLERWETKLVNCEDTREVIWPIAKSLSKRREPKAPSAIHRPLCSIFYPIDKANTTAHWLKTSSKHTTCETVTTDDMWRLKQKTCWLPSMKISLLISDPLT
jgi:hypothetical protein